jgi:hypothetical protein
MRRSQIREFGSAVDRLDRGSSSLKTLPSDVESKHPHNLRSANSDRFPEYKLALFLIVVSSDVVCERVWCFACLVGCLVAVALPSLLGAHQPSGADANLLASCPPP